MLEVAARATLLRFSRGERALGTHQGRLPQELALAGISTMAQANPYLANRYRPAFNTESPNQRRTRAAPLCRELT